MGRFLPFEDRRLKNQSGVWGTLWYKYVGINGVLLLIIPTSF